MIRLLTWTDEGNLVFQEFEGSSVPAYAILSHTWSTNNNEEVTYDDLQGANGEHGHHKAGYCKIDFCKKQASIDHLSFMWIDTCCINRKSEPELSEAINSMFAWYENAAHCYVHLTDVSTGHNENRTNSCIDRRGDSFLRSRWFTRGWTLQELIAPKVVQFFTKDGIYVGDKSTLEASISEVTGIAPDVSRGRLLNTCTVEERLAWAKTRKTKREEDHVYLLLGIFAVSMPLIYGEGKAKTFRRLYEQLSKYSECMVSLYEAYA